MGTESQLGKMENTGNGWWWPPDLNVLMSLSRALKNASDGKFYVVYI